MNYKAKAQIIKVGFIDLVQPGIYNWHMDGMGLVPIFEIYANGVLKKLGGYTLQELKAIELRHHRNN